MVSEAKKHMQEYKNNLPKHGKCYVLLTLSSVKKFSTVINFRMGSRAATQFGQPLLYPQYIAG